MTALAVEALIASTLLMALVLALRTPVRRAFGPRVAYALWLLPVLRLVLPPLPEGWRGDALPMLRAETPMTLYLGEPVVTLPADGGTGAIGWVALLVGVWLAGAAAFMIWQAARYLRFRHRVLRNGIAVDRAGSITIVESVEATGPLAFGVFDRVVAFPRDFAARFDAAERELALAHELGHHARGDLVANWVGLGLLALHWFNPVAWMAYRAFRADQEMANDAGVMERCGASARHAYGCAIVKAAHGQALSAACHLHNVRDLKGRLRMLARGRLSRRRVFAGTGLTASLAVLALGATASGTRAAERVRTGVEQATGVELAAIDDAIVEAAESTPAPPQITAPEVPATPRTPASGTKVHRVVVVEDGRRTTYEGKAADAYAAAHPAPPAPMAPQAPTADELPPPPPPPPQAPPPPTVMRNVRITGTPVIVTPGAPFVIRHARIEERPDVTSVTRDCAADEGAPGAGVVRMQEGARQVLVVCRNRIAAMQRSAARQAAAARRTEHAALLSALSGLENARRGLIRNRSLTGEARDHALAGIEQALTEMRANVAGLH